MIRSLPRVAVTAACAALINLPTVWLLAAHGGNVVKVPVVESSDSLEAVPIELSYLDYPRERGTHRAVMVMQQQRPESLAAHQRLDLLVATFDTAPQLRLATLSIEGTPCKFESRRGSAFPNNGRVRLFRLRDCDRMSGMPTGRLRLEVRFDGPGRVALWTYRAPAGSINPTRIYVADPTYAEQGVLCAVRADYVDDFGHSSLRRVDLLAYVWQLGGPTWIWSAVAMSTLLVIIALLIAPTATGRLGTARMAVAAGSTTLAIATLYAVFVPPFQGPDEPSHFLGYAYVTENPRVAIEAEEWARRIHFQRIRFDPDEQFHAADIGVPYHATWDKISTQDFARSSVSVRLWRALAPTLRPHRVSLQFLELRVLNAALFALAAMFLAGVLWRGGFRHAGAILALPLFIPTLPFLAMHVSNYGPAIAAYVLIAGGVGLLALDTEGSALAGVLIGAGGALALTSTHSALPMMVLLMASTSFRMLLGSPVEWPPSTKLRSALTFWIGVGAGLLLYSMLVTEWQALRYQQEFEHGGPWLFWAYRLAAVHGALLGSGFIVAGAIVELLCAGLRSRVGPAIDGYAWAIRTVSRVMALAVIASLVLSVFLTMPALEPATRNTTMSVYVRQALTSSLTMLRLRNHDPLLAVSFWSGLGWLDTIPPYVTTLLAGSTGLAASVALWQAQSSRRTSWLLVILVTVSGVVALYAAAALRLSPDLHGRYVLGGYLAGVYAVWLTAVAGDSAPAASSSRFKVAGTCFGLLALATNAIALATVLTRYF